ncbi:MAG: hypothetical protein KJ062_22530 [Thermoanaerobaculia bacterium]|nr:hypothetical protein [Thermoanaerobaculia bacterium]
MRHTRRARKFLALGLLAGLLPLVFASPVAAVCPAPVAAMPTGCCPPAPPPACPACPSESRPSCPTPQPARARTCCSPAALPPGETEPETRTARARATTISTSETAPSTPGRSAALARRLVVQSSSPPPRLLTCTLRN